jgi:hypothetical protein
LKRARVSGGSLGAVALPERRGSSGRPERGSVPVAGVSGAFSRSSSPRIPTQRGRFPARGSPSWRVNLGDSQSRRRIPHQHQNDSCNDLRRACRLAFDWLVGREPIVLRQGSNNVTRSPGRSWPTRDTSATTPARSESSLPRARESPRQDDAGIGRGTGRGVGPGSKRPVRQDGPL